MHTTVRDILLVIFFLLTFFIFRDFPYRPVRGASEKPSKAAAVQETPSRIPKLPALTHEPELLSEEKEVVQPFSLNAFAVVVWEIEKGRVLLVKNPSWRLPIASLTKLMTALVTAEELGSLDEEVIVSPEALQEEELIGNLKEGERLTAKQLLAAALIPSSNDAAGALADYVGRKFLETLFPEKSFSYQEKVAAFVELMNRKAKELGMKDTIFRTPTGLDHTGQYSTVNDLKILVDTIWRDHREIFSFTRQLSYQTRSLDGNEHSWKNTNLLLDEEGDIVGGKTGFSTLAQGTLLTIWQFSPERTIAAVVLDTPDRFGEMRKIIRWSKQ